MQRPYLNDRLIEERPEGYVVIVPNDVEPPVPLACPVCDHVMRTREDEQAYREFTCCERCMMLWAQARRVDWGQGWRPTQGQVDVANDERPPLTLVFDVE